DLGLPRASLALALVGFNIGVEAGQLAIVVLFLPCAYALRNTQIYRSALFKGGSAMIAVVGALWFAERALDLRFLPVH
ncbi:MAG: HupE/UreJ family protein, partial [Steroidobacteraceae bacterium]